MSIEELNPLVVLCIPINQSGDEGVRKEMEIKKRACKVYAESAVENNLNEQKEVGGRKIVKMRLVVNTKGSSENYYRELEDKEEKNNPEDRIKLNYEKLNYEYIKETKILSDYVCVISY